MPDPDPDPLALPDSISPAEQQFLKGLFEDDLSLEAAAFEAWPAKADPIRLALVYLKNNDFVRARFHTYLDQNELTDLDVAKNLKRAVTLSEDDPKASTALLNVMKEVAKLKDLYAPPAQPSIAEALHLNAPLTQINVVNQYMDRALEAGLTKQDIEKLTEAPIITVDVVPKDKLFDD